MAIVETDFKRRIAIANEKRRYLSAQDKDIKKARKELTDYYKSLPIPDPDSYKKRIEGFERQILLDEIKIGQSLLNETGAMQLDKEGKIVFGEDGTPLPEKYQSSYNTDYEKWRSSIPQSDREQLEKLEQNYRDAIASSSQANKDYVKAMEALELEKATKKSYYDHRFAPMLASRVPDLIFHGSRIGLLYEAAKKPFRKDPIHGIEALQAYADLSVHEFYDAFRSGNNIADSVLYQHAGYGVNASLYSVREAALNIDAKNGSTVLWDLETLGGANDHGMPGSQRITEFSFVEAQGKMGTGNFTTGAEHGSIIGFSEKEYQYHKSLIEKLRTGKDLTEGQKVSLHRLALMGGKDTKIDWDKWEKDGRGIFRYDNFAEKDQIGGTVDEMLNGLEQMRKIGRLQEATKMANGMFGWEQELLNGLHSIIDEDITAVGHNTTGFDIRHLDALLHDKNTSSAFRTKVSELLGNKSLSFAHNFDDMPLERGLIKDRQKFLLDILNGDGKKLRQLNQWMEANGQSQLTQETILEAFRLRDNKARIQQGAHNAYEDAKGTGAMVYSYLFDPTNKESLTASGKVGSAQKLLANGSEIFMATQSTFNAKSNNVMIFTHDAMSGQIRSSDGISFDALGNVTEEPYGQSGVRRRGLYSLMGMGDLTADSKIYKAIAGAHPSMDMGALMYVAVNPYTTSDTAVAQSPVYMVGTREQLMKQFNQTFLRAGSHVNGEYTLKGASKSDLEKLATVIDEKGKFKVVDATEDSLVEISNFAFGNDSAARTAREKSARKDANLLRYIQTMDKYAENKVRSNMALNADGTLSHWNERVAGLSGVTKEDALNYYRDRFRQKLRKRTAQIMQGKYVHGTVGKVTKANSQMSYYDFFGWDDASTGERVVHSNSASNMVALENYGRHNLEVIQKSMAYAEAHSGTADRNSPLFQSYYKLARDTIETTAVAQANAGKDILWERQIDKSVLGYTKQGRILNEVDSQFVVDIDGFSGKKFYGGKNVTFKFGVSGIGVADKIYRAMGTPKAAVDKISPQKKVKKLLAFQDFLIKERHINLSDASQRIISAEDSLDVAGSKILSMLQSVRDDENGLQKAMGLSDTSVHDIIHVSQDNLGMTSTQIDSALASINRSLIIAPNAWKKPHVENGKVVYDRNPSRTNFIEDFATEINDNVLFNNGVSNDKDEFVAQMLEHGYDKKDAEILYEAQQLKRTESQKMVAGLLDTIYANGGMVGYNEDGHIFMYNSAADYNAKNAHEIFLPKQTFEDGAFFIRTGENGTRHIDPLMVASLGRKDGTATLELTSILGAARRENEGLMRGVLYNNAENGLLHEGVEYYLKRLNRRYSEFSTSMTGANQDRVLTSTLYLGEATKEMGALSRSKALQTVAEGNTIASKVIAEMLGKPEEYAKSLHDLSYANSASLLQNAEALAKAISENIGNGKELYMKMLPGLGHLVGHGEKGFFRAIHNTQNALQVTHANQNQIEDKFNRIAYFNTETEEAKVLEQQGVRFGAAIRSTFEEANAKGAGRNLGYSLENTLVGKRLSIESADWRTAVAKMVAAGVVEKGSYDHRLLGSVITDEGAGMITSYAADAALTHRFYEQHIKAASVALASDETGGTANYGRFFKGELGDVTPGLSKVTDAAGNLIGVNYTSNNGTFVRQGDILFNKMGAYGRPEPVRAKQKGYLRLGVFQDGLLMSDERVGGLLSTRENLARLQKAGDGWEAEAYRILQNTQGVSNDYYVDELDISGNIKIGEFNEKNVGRVSIAGLGEKDKRIAKALTKFKATELIGAEVTPDFVRELMDYSKNKKRLAHTKFGIAINGMSDEVFGEKRMLAVLQSAGFNSVEEFGQAIYKERHSVTDSMMDGLRQIGLLGKDEYIQGVFDNFPGLQKHGDTTPVKSLILELESRGVGKEAILDTMKEVIPGIQLDASGNFIYDRRAEGNHIDFLKLQEIADKRFGTSGKYSNGETVHDTMRVVDFYGDTIRAEVSMSEFRQMQNLDELRASSDGMHEIKLDERIYSNLGLHSYTGRFLDTIGGRLEQTFGEELGRDIYDKYFEGRHAGDLLNGSLAKSMQRSMFYTGGEDRVFDSFNSNFTTEEQGRAVTKLKDMGMTTKQIDNVVKVMATNGADRITWDKVFEYHSAFSSTAAMNFNRHGTTDKVTLEQMQKAGFRVVSIDNLDADAMSSFVAEGDAGYEKFINSMNGQQLIIDMHSEQLEKMGASQIYNSEAQRYVAIPFQAVGQRNPDGSIMTSRVGGRVAAMMRRFEDYRDNYVSMTSDPEAQREAKWAVRSSADSIRDMISEETTTKDGIVKKASTGHFTEGVANLTAQGHQFYGDGMDSFSHFNFMGHNLSEMAGENEVIRKSMDELLAKNPNMSVREAREVVGHQMELGYAIMGREVQRSWYNKDLFMELTGGNEEAASSLQKSVEEHFDNGSATLTTRLRHPAQRNRSYGVHAAFFDSSVGKDEVLLSIREWLQMKGDFDSDKDSEGLLKSKATITWGEGKNARTVHTDQLDFASYQVLSRRNDVTVQLHDDVFKDAIGEMVNAAYDYQPNASPRSSEWKGDSLNVGKLKNATWDGRHSIDYSRTYSTEQRSTYSAMYSQLAEDFSSAYKGEAKAGSAEYLGEMAKFASAKENSKELLEAMHFNAWADAETSIRNSHASKLAAGPLNDVIYKWQRIGAFSGALSGEEEDLLRTSIAAIQEATLTGKSETGETDLQKIEKMQKIHQDAYTAMRTGKGREAAANAMVEFYAGMFEERAQKEFATHPGDAWGEGSQMKWWLDMGGQEIEKTIRAEGMQQGLNAYEINNRITARQAAELTGRMVRNISLSGSSLQAMRLGVTSKGIDANQELVTYSDNAEASMQSKAHSMINEIGESYGLERNVIRETAAPSAIRNEHAERAEKIRQQILADSAERAEEQNATTKAAEQKAAVALEGNIRKIAGVFEHTRGLAAAGIGIATGLLTAGYVSGPSSHASPTPAQNQASDASGAEQDVVMQQTPSLSDANMNVARGGPNAGYIININASSPNGQQAAVNAIQNATSGMTPQNGSINLSISTTTANTLSQLQVNRMVANAIGVAG